MFRQRTPLRSVIGQTQASTFHPTKLWTETSSFGRRPRIRSTQILIQKEKAPNKQNFPLSFSSKFATPLVPTFRFLLIPFPRGAPDPHPSPAITLRFPATSRSPPILRHESRVVRSFLSPPSSSSSSSSCFRACALNLSRLLLNRVGFFEKFDSFP